MKKVLALVIVAISFNPFAIASTKASVIVDWKNQQLSLIAKQVTQAEILSSISHAVGLQVDGKLSVTKKISLHFSELPLHDGLQEILKGISYALVNNTSIHTTEPIRLILLATETPTEPPSLPSKTELPGENEDEEVFIADEGSDTSQKEPEELP